MLALCVTPDEQLLRTKVMWVEGLLAATAIYLLIHSIVIGKYVQIDLIFVLMSMTAVALSAGWWALGGLQGRVLFRDEVVRLASLPLSVFCGASVGHARAGRRIVLGALFLGLAPVAALAVGQHLSGLLGLPLDRIERPPGTFGNPVFFAAFLALVLPAALAATLFEVGALRWLAALAAGFGLPALYATQGRAGWAGCAAALVTGTLLLVPTRRHRLALLGALALAGGALLAANRAALLRPTEHTLIWRDTGRMVLDHPWGVGPGQFQVAFPPYASTELLAAHPRAQSIINDAHSEPLQLLAELGWAGSLVVLAATLALAAAARRALRTLDPADRPLGVGLASGLLGWTVTSLASPDARFLVTPVAFGCLAGLLLAPASRVVSLGPSGRVLAALLAIAVLFLGAGRLQQRLELRELAAPPPVIAESAEASAAGLDLARQLVAANPLDPEAHFRLGRAAAAARDWVAAAQAFETCSRLAPGHLAARRATALTQALAGRLDVAVPALQDWLATQPDDADARYLLAYSLFTQGDIPGALQEVESLLVHHPQHRLGLLLRERLRE